MLGWGKKTDFGVRLRNFFWPRSGWRRSTQYIVHRLSRLPGTPYSLAAGFACGAAASFTPFVGLHIVLAAFLAWIIRANLLASLIGTAVGNPWTFPFIWVWIYKLGTWFGIGGVPEGQRLDFIGAFGAFFKALLSFDSHNVIAVIWPLWGPMLVGGIPSAILVGFGFYLPLKPLVAAYQRRRQERRIKKKRKKLA